MQTNLSLDSVLLKEAKRLGVNVVQEVVMVTQYMASVLASELRLGVNSRMKYP